LCGHVDGGGVFGYGDLELNAWATYYSQMVVKLPPYLCFLLLLSGSPASADEAKSTVPEGGINNSIHDNSWWRPAYDKAVNQNDCSKAVLILNRAVKAGNINAHGSLAAFNMDGTCVNKDFIKSIALFRYGAERGNTSAAVLMTQAYFSEKGADEPAAKKWAYRAQFAMISLEPKYWKKIIRKLQVMGPLSPHLKQAFS